MADKATWVEIPWIKSQNYRVITPDSATVTGAETAEGVFVFVRFTNTWLDMTGERFEVREVPAGALVGSVAQSGPPEFAQRPVKIEEVSIKMTPNLAGQLVRLFLQSYDAFSPDTKAQVRAAIGKLPKE